MLRQYVAQVAQTTADKIHRVGAAERDTDDVGLVRDGRRRDVRDWRLGTERHDIGRLAGEDGFHHDQSQRMLLIRKRGQQDFRRLSGELHGRDGIAQYAQRKFRIEVFLENFQIAAHPGFADHDIERGDGINDELMQSAAHELVMKQFLQFLALMFFYQGQEAFQFMRILVRRCGLPAFFGKFE